GTEQEIFSMDELIAAFNLAQVSKSGARFDFDKIKWFNQQYLKNQSGDELAAHVLPEIEAAGYSPAPVYLANVCYLMRDRITVYPDLLRDGLYFFTDEFPKDMDTFRKKWNPEHEYVFDGIANVLNNWNTGSRDE